MSNLPTYSSRYGHGEQVYMQPCDTTGGTQYVFVVAADAVKQSANANGFLGLNAAGKVSFQAIGDLALVHFIRAPRLTSIGQKVGYVVDRETAVSMPLVMKKEGLLLPSYQLTTWMPYVLINSQGGCTAGREIFGFLKGLGDITIPALDEPLKRWQASTQVFTQMDPNCEATWAPLWTVDAIGGPATRNELWKDMDEFAAWMEQNLRGWPILEELELLVSALELLAARTFPTINLKQFRDAGDGTKASMQQLVTAPMQVTQLRGGGILGGNFQLTLPTYASHDVAGDIAATGGTGDVYPVKMGFYIDFDFIVPDGTIEWEYP